MGDFDKNGLNKSVMSLSYSAFRLINVSAKLALHKLKYNDLEGVIEELKDITETCEDTVKSLNQAQKIDSM